jgi:hypothetical protein
MKCGRSVLVRADYRSETWGKLVLRLTLLKHLGSRVERQVPYPICTARYQLLALALQTYCTAIQPTSQTHVLVKFMFPETLIVPGIALPQGVHVPQKVLISGSFDDGLLTSHRITSSSSSPIHRM